MVGMKQVGAQLTFLLATVGPPRVGHAPAKAVSEPRRPQRPCLESRRKDTVTVHRCVDAKACDAARRALSPRNPRQRARDDPTEGSAPAALLHRLQSSSHAREEIVQRREIIPPPPIYKCTNMHGERASASSTIHRAASRSCCITLCGCQHAGGAQAITCRWIEDSCVRLTDRRLRSLRRCARKRSRRSCMPSATLPPTASRSSRVDADRQRELRITLVTSGHA